MHSQTSIPAGSLRWGRSSNNRRAASRTGAAFALAGIPGMPMDELLESALHGGGQAAEHFANGLANFLGKGREPTTQWRLLVDKLKPLHYFSQQPGFQRKIELIEGAASVQERIHERAEDLGNPYGQEVNAVAVSGRQSAATAMENYLLQCAGQSPRPSSEASALPGPHNTLEVLGGLARMRRPSSVRAATVVLRSEAPWVDDLHRTTAISVLREIGNERATQTLHRVAHDPVFSDDVRTAASQAIQNRPIPLAEPFDPIRASVRELARIGDSDSVETIRQIVRSPGTDLRSRFIAIQELAMLADTESIGALLHIAVGREPIELQVAAIGAAQSIQQTMDYGPSLALSGKSL